MRVAGIDPGTTGAVALVRRFQGEVHDIPTHQVSAMKQVDPLGLSRLLIQLEPDVVFVEDVKANAISYKSNFALGHALGCIVTAIALNGIPMYRIRAKEWQQATGLTSIPAKERKQAHRGRATEMFPALTDRLHRVADHNRADALLIAEAGRRQIEGG